MSKAIAINNLDNQSWEVTYQEVAPSYVDIYINFIYQTPGTKFKNLKFKYELKQGENIKQYGVYPPAGVRYLQSDQQYLVSERITLQPDTEYTLYLWSENDNIQSETTSTFSSPRPSQPYPSWNWEDKKWNPPVPVPDTQTLYNWNEENQEWETLEATPEE